MLWEILVPKTDNEGNTIDISVHEEWDTFVKRLASGLTILRSSKGMWLSPNGTSFEERMIPVRIMCGRKTIKKIAKFTLSHYNQEAVMYYKVSDDCRIMHA